MTHTAVNALAHTLAANLAAVLNEQIECAQAMLGTLARENQALIDGDTETLNAAGADKARLVAALETLETERRQLTDAFAAGAAASPPSAIGADEWRRLLELVAECKRRNQRNGALLKARSEQVRTALKLIRGAEPQVYDGSGFTAAARGTRALGSA